MYDRRKSGTFSDYRSVLARRGDVEIGAFARRRRRRAIVLVLLSVVLLVGAAWLYRALGSEGTTSNDKVRVKVRCSRPDCNYTGTVTVVPGTHYPVECPSCGERSCWPLWQCLNPRCGKEFVPEERGTVIKCPFCGSTDVGAAVPDDP